MILLVSRGDPSLFFIENLFDLDLFLIRLQEELNLNLLNATRVFLTTRLEALLHLLIITFFFDIRVFVYVHIPPDYIHKAYFFSSDLSNSYSINI